MYLKKLIKNVDLNKGERKKEEGRFRTKEENALLEKINKKEMEI